MLRLCWVLIIFILTSAMAFSDELILDNETVYQKRVMETGFRLLNANNIEKRITFYYIPENKVKAVHKHKSMIYTYKGLLPFIENDDELAAVLSKEIALLLDERHNLFRLCTMGFSPLKYDKKSDKKAVDYMVHAGYNPIGLITIINKTVPEKGLIDIAHYKGSERTVIVYRHIYEKYPQYLSKNIYLKNDAYQNFLHTTRPERRKIRTIQQERAKLHKHQIKKEMS